MLVNEKTSHTALLAAVWAAPTLGLLRDASVFDIYRPKAGKDAAPEALLTSEKSMALRLTLNSEEATLTDEQIDSVVQAVLSSLVSALGARQRA